MEVDQIKPNHLYPCWHDWHGNQPCTTVACMDNMTINMAFMGDICTPQLLYFPSTNKEEL
jgi:hypothetical protein